MSPTVYAGYTAVVNINKGRYSYSLLQDLCFRKLWISKVHQLIQQFINDHEIVSDALLFKFFEVLCKHLQDNY